MKNASCFLKVLFSFQRPTHVNATRRSALAAAVNSIEQLLKVNPVIDWVFKIFTKSDLRKFREGRRLDLLPAMIIFNLLNLPKRGILPPPAGKQNYRSDSSSPPLLSFYTPADRGNNPSVSSPVRPFVGQSMKFPHF